MSDSEQEAVPTNSARHRVGRLIGAAGVFVVLALFAALTMWAVRPRWYTFVSKPTAAPSRVALVLRVPVGWECRDGWMDDGMVIIIRLHRKPLTGFAQWWNQHVLRLDTQQRASATSVIFLYSGLFDMSPDDRIQEIRHSYQSYVRPGYLTTFRTFDHPLGPAFDVTHALRGSGTRRRRGSERDDESTYIILRQHTKRDCVWIRAIRAEPTAGFDRFQFTWDEIVRSIRIVQK